MSSPAGLDDPALSWLAATVPGTAAVALVTTERSSSNLDDEDWWFRTEFDSPGTGPWDLVSEGLATIADVWVNDTLLGHSDNMFRHHRFELDDLQDCGNVLVVRCAALSPVLAARRRPRPHWKARLPSDQALRWIRTTLFGRSPSWTPDVAPVGPWRPVFLQRRPLVTLGRRRLQVGYDGAAGTIECRLEVSLATDAGEVAADLVVGDDRSRLTVTPLGDRHEFELSGSLLAPSAEPWWPSSHGSQPLYAARLELTLDGTRADIEVGRIGFRTITFDRADQPVLKVNGTPVFCRGACWMPLDPVGMNSDPQLLRKTLEQASEAGMNMVRVQGSMVYETDCFHDLCDELGLLVWQDLMFATMSYPADDAEFLAEVEAEVAEVLQRLQRHPSTALVCGGSEVHQQSAMLGRFDVDEADPLFDRLLAELTAEHLPGTAYWPNSPSWSGHAFSVDTGVSHYFGVGGYRRPLSDARTSGVRFASECLAFSCVPGDSTLAEVRREGLVVGTGAWKDGVPRDAGRAWDFEDVRDHYVIDRFGIDPGQTRAIDPDHYLDLSRAAVAEVMAATFSEWRRAGSPCQGALILSLRDLVDGAGFGLIDARGRPKSPWFALRRVLQPTAVLICDEGLNGLDVHLLNDGPDTLGGTLRVTAHSGPNLVAEGEITCTVAGRSDLAVRAETVLGGFYDIGWAYRFGPRSVDCVSASWQPTERPAVHAVFVPGGAPPERTDRGLTATFAPRADGATELSISTESVARCVLVGTAGQPSDDAFDLEPGRVATVLIADAGPRPITVRSVNTRHEVTATPATR